MKVKDLIELLQKMPQDLEVYGYCDHSQQPEKVSRPQVSWCRDIEQWLDDGSWTNWADEAQEEGWTEEFVLL